MALIPRLYDSEQSHQKNAHPFPIPVSSILAQVQPGKGGRIQRFTQGLCSDGPIKAGSSWSQGSSAAVLQPVQASKPTVRCLWPWNPLHFGALSQSEGPKGEAHLLGRVGEDSSPFPPESECRLPTGRQRRHLSYKDALRVSQPVCPQVLLCSLPWSPVLSSDCSVLFPAQVLSWASGYLQAASANELLAGKQLFLDPLQDMQETGPT